MLFEPARHERLERTPWRPSRVRDAIVAIVDDNVDAVWDRWVYDARAKRHLWTQHLYGSRAVSRRRARARRQWCSRC
jgi:hypothetical protein